MSRSALPAATKSKRWLASSNTLRRSAVESARNGQQPAKLGACQGAPGDDLARDVGEHGIVQPRRLPAELALPGTAVENALDERTHPAIVVAGEEVLCAADHRSAHHDTAGEKRGELFVAEALDPRPQADVGGIRLLALQRHEVTNDLERGTAGAYAQELPLEQGAVQGALGEGCHRRHV
jgi:hypothetical protein